MNVKRTDWNCWRYYRAYFTSKWILFIFYFFSSAWSTHA